MQIRLRHGRRVQTYLKLAAYALLAVFYFTFLFRESLHAFEQNKDKAAADANLAATGAKKLELKPAAKVSKLSSHHAKQSQQQVTTQAAIAIVTAPSTLNPVYEYSEEIHTATEKQLQQRRDHLNSVCQRYNLQSHYPPNPWEFFISPGHALVWCNVFKAASSTWMYYFNILGGYKTEFLQRTENQPLELARKRFPRPEINELFDSLPSSLSFLFVRDPFERLVSAYRNKLEGGRNSYYKALGHKIVHKFRKLASGVRPRSGPTFSEFLQYVIEQHALKQRLDEHWAPVYSFCTPCSINFTIIGKMETFERDSEYIIRQAGLEYLLLGKLPKRKLRQINNLAAGGVKTDTLVDRYFSEIDRTALDQLLKIYSLDFELFDYNYSKYYDMVQPSPETTAASPARKHTEADNANALSTTTQNSTK